MKNELNVLQSDLGLASKIIDVTLFFFPLSFLEWLVLGRHIIAIHWVAKPGENNSTDK